MVLLEGGPNRPLRYTDTQPWNTSNCLIEWLFSMVGNNIICLMISCIMYFTAWSQLNEDNLSCGQTGCLWFMKISHYSNNQQDLIKLDKTNLAWWFYMRYVRYYNVTPFFLLYNHLCLNGSVFLFLCIYGTWPTISNWSCVFLLVLPWMTKLQLQHWIDLERLITLILNKRQGEREHVFMLLKNENILYLYYINLVSLIVYNFIK